MSQWKQRYIKCLKWQSPILTALVNEEATKTTSLWSWKGAIRNKKILNIGETTKRAGTRANNKEALVFERLTQIRLNPSPCYPGNKPCEMLTTDEELGAGHASLCEVHGGDGKCSNMMLQHGSCNRLPHQTPELSEVCHLCTVLRPPPLSLRSLSTQMLAEFLAIDRNNYELMKKKSKLGRV